MLNEVTAGPEGLVALARLSLAHATNRAVLDTLLAHAPIGFALLDTELRFQQLNDALAEINGPSVAAHLGRTVRDIVPSG